MKRKKKSGAPCMPNIGTVSSFLQSFDSHGSSEIEPRYAARPMPPSPACRYWK